MRSAKAPVISAGVMMAKVIWNIMKTDSGMVVRQVAYRRSAAMPLRKQLVEAADAACSRRRREGQAVADDHPQHASPGR